MHISSTSHLRSTKRVLFGLCLVSCVNSSGAEAGIFSEYHVNAMTADRQSSYWLCVRKHGSFPSTKYVLNHITDIHSLLMSSSEIWGHLFGSLICSGQNDCLWENQDCQLLTRSSSNGYPRPRQFFQVNRSNCQDWNGKIALGPVYRILMWIQWGCWCLYSSTDILWNTQYLHHGMSITFSTLCSYIHHGIHGIPWLQGFFDNKWCTFKTQNYQKN